MTKLLDNSIELDSITIKSIIPFQQSIIEMFNSNIEKGLTLKQNLESMTDFQLFCYIFISSYQYFREANGCWQSKYSSGVQALENAKCKFADSRNDIIKCYTTDWDNYNLM